MKKYALVLICLGLLSCARAPATPAQSSHCSSSDPVSPSLVLDYQITLPNMARADGRYPLIVVLGREGQKVIHPPR